LLKVLNGTIVQSYTIEIKKSLEEDIQDVLCTAIIEMRNRIQSTSKLIVVPVDIDFKLENVDYIVPKGGEKKKLLEMSYKNCIIYAQELEKRKIHENRESKSLMLDLQKELSLKSLPYHIECFDNSNLQGTNPSSSCIVFKDARASKKDYRHFNVKTVKGIDDFATIQEVVYRRYRRLIEEKKPLPNFIVIDGGKGQLNAAIESLNQLAILDKVEICGIAKRNEELIFSDRPNPIVLDRKSRALKLLQQVRDEAHRFGLKHHQNRRSKGTNKSQLENIPGIGKATIRKIYLNYRSVNQIDIDDFESFSKIVGKDKATKILGFLRTKTI
jgi:excinuclease ABC subunit C